MVFEQKSQQIADEYKLSNSAIHSQRALLIGAQTFYHTELRIGKMTDAVREAWLGRCWGASFLQQESRSRRYPLADAQQESRRMYAVVLAASVQVLDHLSDMGVETTVLQTPLLYARALPHAIPEESFEPLVLLAHLPLHGAA